MTQINVTSLGKAASVYNYANNTSTRSHKKHLFASLKNHQQFNTRWIFCLFWLKKCNWCQENNFRRRFCRRFRFLLSENFRFFRNSIFACCRFWMLDPAQDEILSFSFQSYDVQNRRLSQCDVLHFRKQILKSLSARSSDVFWRFYDLETRSNDF